MEERSCSEGQPYTIAIDLDPEKDGYRLEWHSVGAVFSSSDLRRRKDHFHTLLVDALNYPDRDVSTLRLLPAWEEDLVLRQWNHTATDYPRQSDIGTLFEEIARTFPGKTAVQDVRSHLTYEALAAKARAFALLLKRRGIERGARVGVALERETELIVVLLGVIQAGAAFVPLDRAYPIERLAFMVEDAGLPIVVTDVKTAPALAALRCTVLPLETLDLDPSLDEGAGRSNENTATHDDVLPQCSPEDVALVMYTSGTTGKPKGVLVTHRAVVRLVRNTNYVQFGPADVVGQIANISFDAVTFEVFGALLNGGCLRIFPDDDVLSPRRFRAATHRWQISKMFVTAALFDVIVRAEPDAFAPLETLVVGGDALNVKTIRQLLATAPPRRLVNGYGPTEAATFSVCHIIQNVPEDAASIPIGRPISNSTAFVLDRHLQPVPIGVQGELYLGGDGVALGYLNRPELTAERFPADPFRLGQLDELGPARLYKSGDLARWMPDGTIEFFGRNDHQVKFNGFRIELGEIETALRRHPAVADALVLMRADVVGFKTLVAYVVPIHAKGAGLPATWNGELRQWLSGHIPAFMLPNTVVLLDQFPLTSRGKVDRDALPDPEARQPKTSSQTDLLPLDTPEARVLSVWRGVLHLDDVGLDTSFFELGGTSIKIAAMEGELQRRWGYEIAATDVFRFPTVRSLARHLGGNEPDQSHRNDNASVRAAKQRAAYARRRVSLTESPISTQIDS